MGKLIVCNGVTAGKPYYMGLIRGNVYSIEELCFYMAEHLELLSEEMFTINLAEWIKEELQLPDRADLFLELLNKKATVKDLAVCLFCSCDYYTEAEIKQFITRLDILQNMSPFEKRKRRADRYLYHGQYQKAREEYEALLYGKQEIKVSHAQYGLLLHNLAIVKIHTTGLSSGVHDFKEAYDRGGNIKSLKQYIQGLLLLGKEELVHETVREYKVKEALLEEAKEELNISYKNYDTPEVKLIEEMRRDKENGRIIAFYQGAETFIEILKEEYRKENG